MGECGEESLPDSDCQVISGVINDVRQSFLDSGMDLETLAKLEKLWISKLSSKVENEPGQIGIQEPETGVINAGENVTNDEIGSIKCKVRKGKKLKIEQVDGPADSSDEDEDKENEDDDDDDDDVEEDDDSDSDLDPDGNVYDEGVEMDPPGSGDDNSDEEACDLFDTENVVVCQYDKISRTRNKWKFHLKDGVMNLDGRDYVFQKAHGEVDW
eukprot:GFUD01039285.1.p1 GENE.GFUD01039285.1~~GFUD01039285.1.p1  ORF type:complete len:230 (+),score=87.48 GFUD01039285.1:54-692(+)